MSLGAEGRILLGTAIERREDPVCWYAGLVLELPKLGLWDQNGVMGLN